MYDPLRNLSLLIAPSQGRVRRGANAHPLLLSVFPECLKESAPDEGSDVLLAGADFAPHGDGVLAQILRKPLGRHVGASAQSRHYALLPRQSRVRLAAGLDDAACFRKGLGTYRPGGRLNRALLRIAERLGPAFFTGAMLRVSGSGLENSPAERAARAFHPEGRLAALFLGSPGETNTALLRLVGPRRGAFAKLATGRAAAPYVKAEGQRLDGFAKAPLKYARVPEVIGQVKIEGAPLLILSEAASEEARQVPFEGAEMLDLLVELNGRGRIEGPLGESALAQRVERRLKAAPHPSLSQAWRWAKESLGQAALPLGLGHGDFVPWNFLKDGNRLVALDWEWSSERIPPGIDLAHFLFQGALNLKRSMPAVEAREGLFVRYLARLELAPELARPLFACYLVDWILFETVVGEKPIGEVKAHLEALEGLGA